MRIHKTRELVEAEEEYRTDAERPSSGGESGFYADYPLCFERKYNLRAEAQSDAPNDVLKVIQKDRDCDIREWNQGFTPKEHKQMLLDERQRAWQVEREEADRKWRESQATQVFRQYMISVIVTVFCCLCTGVVTLIVADK